MSGAFARGLEIDLKLLGSAVCQQWGRSVSPPSKELEKRGLEFCRFADDCNIFVKSQKAADRVMGSISNFIEKKLKLVVSKERYKIRFSVERANSYLKDSFPPKRLYVRGMRRHFFS